VVVRILLDPEAGKSWSERPHSCLNRSDSSISRKVWRRWQRPEVKMLVDGSTHIVDTNGYVSWSWHEETKGNGGALDPRAMQVRAPEE
jgi:hypothetical protein